MTRANINVPGKGPQIITGCEITLEDGSKINVPISVFADDTGKVPGETGYKGLKVYMEDEEGNTAPVGSKQHTFHNAVIAAADGTDFTNTGYKTLRVIIKSTVTPATRQIDFLGSIDSSFVAINGFKAPDYQTEASNTTGTGTEVWIFDIENYETIRMDLSTLTGTNANTTVKGVVS